jgi:hypothetical protein
MFPYTRRSDKYGNLFSKMHYIKKELHKIGFFSFSPKVVLFFFITLSGSIFSSIAEGYLLGTEFERRLKISRTKTITRINRVDCQST